MVTKRDIRELAQFECEGNDSLLISVSSVSSCSFRFSYAQATSRRSADRDSVPRTV